MKKLLCIIMAAAVLFSMSACGSEKEGATEKYQAERVVKNADGIIDLSQLSSTIAFTELYNMTKAPEVYIGETVKMKGRFEYFQNPETETEYFSCLVSDETACCSQGLEFILEGDYTYPEDYPELSSEITVSGIFEVYDEDGLQYCRLKDAVLSE